MPLFRLLVCAACLFAFTGEARADNYYAVFFSHQGKLLNLPSRSHTWTVFVRVNERGEISESHEINWFSSDGRIGFFRGAGPGRNRECHETIRSALSQGLRVSMWGPFEIQESLFLRSRSRSEQLEGSLFEYSMVDLGRRAWAPNCQHSISDVREDAPRLRTLLARGDRGTIKVARHLSALFVDDGLGDSYRDHPEIAKALGLDRYRIERRSLGR